MLRLPSEQSQKSEQLEHIRSDLFIETLVAEPLFRNVIEVSVTGPHFNECHKYGNMELCRKTQGRYEHIWNNVIEAWQA